MNEFNLIYYIIQEIVILKSHLQSMSGKRLLIWWWQQC